MKSSAAKIIQDEHATLRAVLHTLRAAVTSRHGGSSPDFEFLRAMLSYMDEMPAQHHHAVEEQLLFPKIHQRCPPLRPVLDRLEAEHARGESKVQSLQRALTAWQVVGAERREGFQLLLCEYVDGYLGHMEVEENYILPVAQDYLSAADWTELHEALAGESDRQAAGILAGHHAVLQRIRDPKPSGRAGAAKPFR